jgi:hypothetical protein
MSEEIEVADPVEALPEAAEAQLDFGSALDAAFARLDNPEAESEPEPVEEKATEEPTETEPEAKEESFDPTDDLNEDIGDDWTPKAASRFKQLKSELKTATDELETLRQQASESDIKVKELSGEVASTDIESLQEKLAEYEREKMFTDLEDTQVYKDAITKPLDTIIDNTRELAEKYDVSPDDLVEALAIQDTAEQDERISELLVDATDRDRARIYRTIEDLTPILQKREAMLENASEALGEANLAKEQKEEMELAERARERNSAAKNVVARVQKKLPFLSGIEGLDMAAIQAKAAEVDPSVIHPVDYTYNSVSAQILPSIIKEYMGMRKENETLTDRLAEFEGAEPTMSGSAPSSSAKGEDLSFTERIEAAFAGQ